MKKLLFTLLVPLFTMSVTHDQKKCKQYYSLIPMKECIEMILIEKNFGLYDSEIKSIAFDRIQEIKNLSLPIIKRAKIFSKDISSSFALEEETFPSDIIEYIRPYYEEFNKLPENARIEIILKKMDTKYEIKSEVARNYLQTKKKFLQTEVNTLPITSPVIIPTETMSNQVTTSVGLRFPK